MKETDIITAFLRGGLCAIAEFRSARAETRTFDGTTYADVAWTVEIGDRPYTFSQRLEKVSEALEWKCPFVKGQRIFGQGEAYPLSKGIRGFGIRWTWHPIENIKS